MRTSATSGAPLSGPRCSVIPPPSPYTRSSRQHGPNRPCRWRTTVSSQSVIQPAPARSMNWLTVVHSRATISDSQQIQTCAALITACFYV